LHVIASDYIRLETNPYYCKTPFFEIRRENVVPVAIEYNKSLDEIA